MPSCQIPPEGDPATGGSLVEGFKRLAVTCAPPPSCLAPSSANSNAASGPARYWPKFMTRMPSSAPDISPCRDRGHDVAGEGAHRAPHRLVRHARRVECQYEVGQPLVAVGGQHLGHDLRCTDRKRRAAVANAGHVAEFPDRRQLLERARPDAAGLGVDPHTVKI